MCCSKQPQQGSSLMTAIALITIVALLAVAITRSVELGAESVSLEIVSQRASFAATSGAQLALNRVFAPSGTSTCSDQTMNFASLAGLPACEARVTCTAQVIDGKPYYTLVSDGRCDAGNMQSQRSVIVKATP